ncbi:hypothetical protein APE_1525 [Aeropyrum pernix K1]|uniref:Uncharacterized protein n=1 Tax=Aeropyrum pernix (strain ATCC 700893 / DSM 11879 / JCM 9820 / NBRC 100138 / K1) TaxID=272557 RepID=Q9YBS4_AERPE|nr:hypothetical protein [Aeropyrum pernix]BAA80524.1 hypothetical protein APE_1525 [Aeropyrum pernix K1]
MTREDPLETLLRLLKGFARLRGGVVDILEASGQERFKIHLSSLIRAKREEPTDYMVEDLLAELSRPTQSRRLTKLGIRIVEDRGEVYVEVPTNLLLKLRRETRRRG